MPQLHCDMCGVKFENRDLLAMHMLEHSFTDNGSPESQAKRDTINEKTHRQESIMRLNLNASMVSKMRGSSEQVHCQMCFKAFNDRDMLAMHTLSHTSHKDVRYIQKTESYPCRQCGMVFSYEDVLTLHTISHHKQCPLDLSKKNTLSKRKLIEPCRIEHGPGVIRPPDEKSNFAKCLKLSQSADKLKHDLHNEIKKSEALGPERQLTKSKTPHALVTSPISIDMLSNRIALKDGKSTRDETGNLDAIDDIRRVLVNRGNGLLACQYCGIIFLNRAMFHLHSGLHNHNSPWQCNICGKECSGPLEFSAHVIHS